MSLCSTKRPIGLSPYACMTRQGFKQTMIFLTFVCPEWDRHIYVARQNLILNSISSSASCFSSPSLNLRLARGRPRSARPSRTSFPASGQCQSARGGAEDDLRVLALALHYRAMHCLLSNISNHRPHPSGACRGAASAAAMAGPCVGRPTTSSAPSVQPASWNFGNGLSS